MKLNKGISRRLREIKKERKLTQYQIFKLTGVPQSTISTILKGETKTLKLSTLYAICSGLDIEMSDFFDIDYLKLKDLED